MSPTLDNLSESAPLTGARVGDLRAGDLEDRVRAVERLAKLYRVERVCYLIVTGGSFLLIIAATIRAYSQHESEWPQLVAGLTGPSGLIAFTSSRLLKMWTLSLRMIAAEPVDGPR